MAEKKTEKAPEKVKETAESLYKFFVDLAPGGADEDEEIEVHYASPSVIRRGLEAAKMLMTIQQVVGVRAPAPAAEPAKPKASAVPPETVQQLKESQSEIDRLLIQNMDLNKQTAYLKEKIQLLQKQVERLYNKNEMAKTLKSIETKKMSAVEQVAADGDDGAEQETENGAPPNDPESTIDSPDDLNKEITEELKTEAAAPAAEEEELFGKIDEGK